MRRTMSLQTRFTIIIVVIIFVMSLSMSFYVNGHVQKNMRTTHGNFLSGSAYQLSNQLDQYMWSRAAEIKILKEMEAIKEPSDHIKASRTLQELQNAIPAYSWIGLLDPSGTVRAATNGLLVGTDISARPVYQEGIKGFFVGDVHEAVLLQNLLPNPTGETMKFVDLSTQVIGADGRITGVLAAHLSWNWVKEVEENILDPAENRYEAQALIVSGNDSAVLMGPQELIGQQLELPSISMAKAGKSGWTVETWSDGKEYLTAYLRTDGYQEYDGLGWVILLRQPMEAVVKETGEISRWIDLASFFFALVLGALTWIISGRVLRPLKEMTRAADQLHQGETIKLPETRGVTELESLSRSLSHMVDTLQTRAKLVTESEARFNLALDGAMVGLWDWNMITNQVYFSPTYKKILGLDPERDFSYDAWVESWHPEDAENNQKTMDDYIAGKTNTYQLIHRLRNQQGEYLWLSAAGSLIRSVDGTPARFIGTIEDITNLVREEAKNQELETFFDVSPDLMSITDGEANFVKVNQAWTTLLGYSPEELPSHKFLEFVHPEDVDRTVGSVKKLLEDQRMINFINRYRQKDGVYRSMDWHISLNDTQFYSVARDITVQLENQTRIQDSNELNTTILESAPLGIEIYKESGECIIANATASLILGRPQAQLLDSNFHEISSWKQNSLYGLAMEAIETGTPASRIVSIPVRDGKEIWLNCNLSQFQISGRKHLLLMFQDDTKRKQAEEELQGLNQRLSDLVSSLESNRENSDLLRQMSEMLQICHNEQESYEVIRLFLPRLLPDSLGAIYLMTQKQQLLSSAISWGNVPVLANTVFRMDDCWALRRNRMNLVTPTSSGMRCMPVEPDFNGVCLELPLSASGEIMGLLLIQWQGAEEISEQTIMHSQILAENISLALSNIRLREQLQSKSIRDPLTGAFNRRHMSEVLEREILRAERKQIQLGLLMIDIDHFKRFNDTFGHAAGDRVLVGLKQELEEQMRDSDLVCRMGGEEFVVLLTDTSRDMILQKAEQIRQAVSQMNLTYNGTSLGEITVSIGVAAYPDHGVEESDLLRRADEALYEAKETGRNRAVEARTPSLDC